MDLSVDIEGIRLRNPVILASGTCNYGEELAPLTDLTGLGGIVTKTITPTPRGGNPPPRIVETPSGMLNAIGLQNPGIDDFVEKKWPFLRELDTQIIVNVAGNTVEEFALITEKLERISGIAAIEINISCPNLKAGGENFSSNSQTAASVVEAVRRVSSRPLIAKLSPNVTDIGNVAKAVVDAGANIISLINTLVGMAVDIERRSPLLSNITGGLSGPAIKPIALAMVWKVSQAVDVPIIGIGGIASACDALEFLIAGASAIQVGTINFVNPDVGVTIADGIASYCIDQGVEDVKDLVGSLEM